MKKETCENFVRDHSLDSTWADENVIGRNRLTTANELINSFEYTIKHVSILVSIDGDEFILTDEENLSVRYPASYEV